MKNKIEFLEKLEKEFKNNNYSDYQDVIDYYSELIDDKIESGEKEKNIINGLDSVKKIVAEFNIEKKIKKAENKPSINNNIKALLAVLGVLSLPLLIPSVIVIFAMIIVVIALLFSLLALIVSIILVLGLAIVTLIGGLFLGKIPFYSFLFALGLVLVLSGLLILLLKWLFRQSKEFSLWFIGLLRKKFNTKKVVKNNE